MSGLGIWGSGLGNSRGSHMLSDLGFDWAQQDERNTKPLHPDVGT